MTEDHTPVYNLKTVVQQTGLTPSTLRAWERRYGVPNPGRTTGRQRLYSDHDIGMLRWLNARLQEGLRIRQAVDRWSLLETQGIDPLETEAAPSLPSLHPASLEALRGEWLQACKTFDEAAAEQTLNQAFSLYPVEMACVHILQAGLSAIGEEWYRGQASIQQEHFASALALRRLESLFAAAPPAVRSQTVLVGAPAGEWHSFPALLLVLLLRRRGLHVVYLGANLPSDALLESIHQMQVDLVMLTAQTLISAAALLPDARRLAAEGIPMGYGGWIFNRLPELIDRIPAHYLGADLEAAALKADHLAASPTAPPVPQPVDASLTAALAAFNANRICVENEVLADPASAGIDRGRLWNANLYLGSDLTAALELGAMDYLAPDLQWVRGLLGETQGDAAHLANYLAAYRRALQTCLGDVGEVIFDWEGWESCL